MKFVGCLFVTLILSSSSGFAEAGKQRGVCSKNGNLLWEDTRIGISLGEINRLPSPVPSPPCSCVDLTRECRNAGRADCDALYRECNRAIGSGGQFCVPNQFGAMSCYR